MVAEEHSANHGVAICGLGYMRLGVIARALGGATKMAETLKHPSIPEIETWVYIRIPWVILAAFNLLIGIPWMIETASSALTVVWAISAAIVTVYCAYRVFKLTAGSKN